jgi:hypothetical protein
MDIIWILVGYYLEKEKDDMFESNANDFDFEFIFEL